MGLFRSSIGSMQSFRRNPLHSRFQGLLCGTHSFESLEEVVKSIYRVFFKKCTHFFESQEFVQEQEEFEPYESSYRKEVS